MRYYRFEPDGFPASHEFCRDDEDARKIGFETVIELTRHVGQLVFVSIYDSAGVLVARLPHIPDPAQTPKTSAPGDGGSEPGV